MYKEMKDYFDNYLESEFAKVYKNFQGKVSSYENNTAKALEGIEFAIRSQKGDSTAMEMSLKQEIEELGHFSKRVNTEHLNLIKSVTETMKNVKEKTSSLIDADNKKRELFQQVLEYLTHING